MAQEPDELPGYQRGEPVHDSSASSVYRARRVADGALVVIKRSRGNAVSARQLTRYRNEFELLGSLQCDGVVKARRAGSARRPNRARARRHSRRVAAPLDRNADQSGHRPSGSRSRRSSRRLLGEVHAAHIIHKDITSHNVVYDPDTRRCTLIDFGIATRLRSEENKFQAPAALEGTLAYIAPEQTGRMNRSLDYRADLYSLGVTLYELFTGELPHDSTDPLEMVHFHIAGKPVPPHERSANVPEAVSDIVMKLLQKEPENRYQSAAGVAADFDACRRDARGRRRDRAGFTLATHDAVDRFEPPQKLYGRSAETQMLLQSFERVARGGVEAVMVSGPGRHRQDVARAGDLSADHAPARLLRRPASSISCSRTCRSARSSRRCKISCSSSSPRARKRSRLGATRSASRAPERPTDPRRRARARAHHRPAAARAGARGVRSAEPLQSRVPELRAGVLQDVRIRSCCFSTTCSGPTPRA